MQRCQGRRARRSVGAERLDAGGATRLQKSASRPRGSGSRQRQHNEAPANTQLPPARAGQFPRQGYASRYAPPAVAADPNNGFAVPALGAPGQLPWIRTEMGLSGRLAQGTQKASRASEDDTGASDVPM